MTDRLELAERVEKATGPDVSLDADIAIELFGIEWEPIRCIWQDGDLNTFEIPAYTRSLGAAMSLVPEGWRLFAMNTQANKFQFGLQGQMQKDGIGRDFDFAYAWGNANLPAPALTAAALRASHSQSR